MEKTMKTPIRLGLIGCGGIVQRTHAPAFLSTPDFVSVVAAADAAPENLERVASTFALSPEARYADYRDMLEKAEIDAVSIATPHFLHAEQVIQSAMAGVAVISEKPMATSSEEADAILDAVERHNVPYAVVHNLLFSLPMKAAFAQLRDGTVGTPLFGRAQAMFAKPANLDPTDWRHRKDAGGGCLIDSAYHEIYADEALMGSPVRYVEARVKTLNYQIDVDDLAVMLFEHQNGTVSTVTASWFAPSIGHERGRWCEVHTTNGSIRVNHRPDDPLLRFTRAENWRNLDVPGVAQGPLKDPTGHVGCFAAVFEALASASEMPITGAQARHNLAIIEAARRATAERRAIELDA